MLASDKNVTYHLLTPFCFTLSKKKKKSDMQIKKKREAQ